MSESEKSESEKSDKAEMDDKMFEDFSAKAKEALKAAEELAQQLGDQSVATGHLIYGLTKDESVSLHHIFKDLNVDPAMFAEYVESLPREPETTRGQPFNRHCHTVFERARELAQSLGTKAVTPEHLAVATMSVKAGSCYETLKEFSIEPTYVTMLIMESMGLEEDAVPDWF
jgi:ATP-dependent Clp protease ATP-binding subunit ClpA